jgi:16S rRNA (cytidine1402-2'-O)-methyltransferase
MSTLYVVSTPIGNLEDLTPRAARVLGSVTRVLAEDTRRTRALLHHLDLGTPLVSLHAHNEASRRDQVLRWLGGGEELALVSDAGTPLVSDPGQRLVDAVVEGGFPVVPLPGPSAVLAALVGSGFPGDRFTFLGFPPRKGKDRKELLERVADSSDTVVLFESPERLSALLEELATHCSPRRRVSVARELTKIHEEFIRGRLEEVRAHFREHAPRGELVLVVSGVRDRKPDPAADEAAARALALGLLEEGLSPSRAAREIARRLKVPRNLAYETVQRVASQGRSDEGSR